MAQKSLAERIVEAAADAAAKGFREVGGPNKGPPVERFAGGREEPWCAHMVATIYREAGSPIPGDIPPSRKQHNPIARVKTMWERLVEAGWAVERPKPGDIVVYRLRMESDPGAGWHVGIVTAVSVDGEIFQAVEGNLSDRVQRTHRGISDFRIAGFARVPG